MSKNEVAINVIRKLVKSEQAVDEAMIGASQLLEAMIVGRRELKYTGAAGEAAQARVAEAIASLSESRRAFMAAHAALIDVARKEGLSVASAPDVECDCIPLGAATGSLRIAG